MGETIESQPSNKLILDTCLSYSEVFYRNRGCEKAPLAFLAFLIFRFLTFQGTVSYWIQGYQYICTSIIARNKFVRSINSLLYFHRPQPQPYQFRGRKNTPTYYMYIHSCVHTCNIHVHDKRCISVFCKKCLCRTVPLVTSQLLLQ